MTPARIVPTRELLGELLLELKHPAATLKEPRRRNCASRSASAVTTAPRRPPQSIALEGMRTEV